MSEGPVSFRMPARVNRAGRVTVAAVVEFSETGLQFESTSLCPPGEDILVSVDTEAGTFELPVKTEWWRMEPFASFEQMRFSNGCQLRAPTDAWRRWVEQTRLSMVPDKRGEDTRYTVMHRVKLADGPPRFEQTENLSAGGMYLATPVPYEVGRVLTLEIELPGAPVQIKGEVAYCLDETQAAKKGRRPGIGVRFVDLDEQLKARLELHLGRIALHRSFRKRTELDDVPLAGSLAVYLVPEVLLALMRRRSSGMLHLEHRAIFKDVYFVSGQIVWVNSSDPGEGFSGSPEEKMAFHAHRLQTAVGWFDGAYSFDLDAPAPRDMVQLDGPNLVIDAIRERYSPELVCAWMGLTRETVLRHTRDERLEPTGMLRDMLSCLQEPTSIESLMSLTGLTFEQLVTLLFGAVVAGWLDVHQDQNEAIDAELQRAKRIAEFWQEGPLDTSRLLLPGESAPPSLAPADETALPELSAEAELPEVPVEAELPEVPVEPDLPELSAEADVSADLPEVPVESDLPEVPVEQDLPELSAEAAEPAADEPEAAPATPESNAQTFITAGDVLMRQKDFAGAFKHYSLALAYDPTNAMALGRLEQLKPMILEQERQRLLGKS